MSTQPDEPVIRCRESNRRICCFRGARGGGGGAKVCAAFGNYVALTSRFFTPLCRNSSVGCLRSV